jgi:hypothetical protein
VSKTRWNAGAKKDYINWERMVDLGCLPSTRAISWMEKLVTESKRRIRAPYLLSCASLVLRLERFISFTGVKDVSIGLNRPLRCAAVHLEIGPFVNDNHIATSGSSVRNQLELSS